jgi:formate dehydrogenase subunit beta
MNNQWSLETHGDPLGKVHSLIRQIWLESNLDGMLVTMNGSEDVNALPRYIVDIESIAEINPFKPLMEINIARLIPDLLTSHTYVRIGALLRPCEMRALTEMTKHASFKIDNLLTISVDCLGTLPADEYQWRLQRLEKTHPAEQASSSESTDELAYETLSFARQGGIIPYRYRSACQVCLSPAAEQANINIHILGLPVRQQMLLSVTDPKIAEVNHLEKLTDGIADMALIEQHERILSKMRERHQRTMERVNEGLGGLLPANVDAVIRQLESCG